MKALMKKKITGQQIKFIINMVGLAIFAFSYLYIYTDFVEKTDAAYDEVASIKQAIANTEEKATQQDAILRNTDEVNAQIQAFIDSYPVDITKIDNLLFVEQMEKDLDIIFTSVNTTDSSPFFTTILPIRNVDGSEMTVTTTDDGTQSTSTNAPAGTDATADAATQTDDLTSLVDGQTDTPDSVDTAVSDDVADNSATDLAEVQEVTTMVGTQSTITMNFTTNYEGFQRLVDYINNYPDKTVIDSVSVSADSTTGLLSGSLVIKRYALNGTGKLYEAPVIEDISIGTDNIFGTDSSMEDAATSGEDTITEDETVAETP